VTWAQLQSDGTSDGVLARQYAADGSPQGAAFGVSDSSITPASQQSEPALGLDADGDFAITWVANAVYVDYGAILGRRYAADGTPLGVAFPVSTLQTDVTYYPALAMGADGSFVAAWDSRLADDPVRVHVNAAVFGIAVPQPTAARFGTASYTVEEGPDRRS
jgi:hypothetical protein